MVDSCLGPALRDLQCIFNVTLQEVSLLHPVVTAGRVIGSLLFMKISGRFNMYGIGASTMTMSCCTFAAVPVIPSFWIAIVLSGGAGLANGFTIHAMTTLSGELSKVYDASIHIINLAMSAGLFTGPLIISLFLSDNVCHLPNTTDSGSIHYCNKTASVSQNSSVHSQDEVCNSFSSNVMYGFLFLAVSGLIVSSGYIVARKSFQDDINRNENQLEKNETTVSMTDDMFLFIIMIYTIISGTMMFVYGQFLPTFGIHSNLHASNTKMANISISFYACIVIGRLLGTLCSQVVSQIMLINVCTAGSIVVSVILVYVSETNITCLWIGTSILAVVSAPVFPAVQTWALDTNTHRNILYGILSIVDMVGYAVMSFLTGQLMSNIFIQILNYVMFVVSIVQLISVVLLYLIAYSKLKSERQAISPKRRTVLQAVKLGCNVVHLEGVQHHPLVRQMLALPRWSYYIAEPHGFSSSSKSDKSPYNILSTSTGKLRQNRLDD